jgi:hypothetical protein
VETPFIPSPRYDALAAWGIGALAVIVAIAWVVTWSGGRRSLGTRLAIGAFAVMATSALAALGGTLQRFDLRPPPMAIMIAAVFTLGLTIGLSPYGRWVAASVPLRTLVGLQSFRLPLELVMHRAATLGIMPPELSYSGYNLDILTGTGALLLWIVMRAGVQPPSWVVWVWNLWGCWCLIAIAAIAITTSPLVRLFGDDPRHVNTWVLFFPYVWLPAVLVTIAVAGHVVITRRLLAASTTTAPP